MKFNNLQRAVGVYAGEFLAENLQGSGYAFFIRVSPGACKLGYPRVVEAETEIVGILRLVPPIESVGFHNKKVRQRNNPEPDGVLGSRWRGAGKRDSDRSPECELAGVCLEHTKASQTFFPFDFKVATGQEVHFDGYGIHAIAQIDFADEPKFLVPALEPAGFQKRFQQVRVKPAFQLPGIKGNVHINASDMDFLRRRQKKVWHPTSDNDHGVAKTAENLSDIQEHSFGRFDLSVRVIFPLSR